MSEDFANHQYNRERFQTPQRPQMPQRPHTPNGLHLNNLNRPDSPPQRINLPRQQTEQAFSYIPKNSQSSKGANPANNKKKGGSKKRKPVLPVFLIINLLSNLFDNKNPEYRLLNKSLAYKNPSLVEKELFELLQASLKAMTASNYS
jgi:hypothetical protein